MNKILIVEDEPAMRNGLRDNLEFEGYKVETAVDGKDGLNKIHQSDFDLVILDVMMPELSGYDVLKKIRIEGIELPVIMLTAKGEEVDKVLGLEFGADDYIIKPFSLRELIARIKAVLRRTSPAGATCDEFILIGNLKINFHHYTAFQNNIEAILSHKEAELLNLLYSNKNRNVSRDEILDKVWGENMHITTRTIDNFIVKLRQKIEADPKNPRIILTVHGLGYKLVI
jgi:DNA-binding response OmpR family regulator